MTESKLVGIRVTDGVVKPEWIDFNGHMNVAYYVLAFDLAIDALWARIGITDEYIRDSRGSTFAVESHLTYQQELKDSDPYFVTVELLAYDFKRIHHFQRMYHAEQHFLAATAEWLSLHVDLDIRRVTHWPDSVLESLAGIATTQGRGPRPVEAGRRMMIKSPIYALLEDTKL